MGLIPGLGNVVEFICDDVLHLPEGVGDIASGVANFATGNFPALLEDGLDFLPNVLEGGKGLLNGPKTEPKAPGGPRGPGGGAGAGGGVGGAGGGVGGAAGGGAGPGGADVLNGRAAQILKSKGIDPSTVDPETLKNLEIQQAMADYKSMVELMSNLMKMFSDMQNSIIRNISG